MKKDTIIIPPLVGIGIVVAWTAFLFLLLVVWSPTASAGEFGIEYMPKSWHHKDRSGGREWNEDHKGIGLHYRETDTIVGFMNYDNSRGDNSNLVYGGKLRSCLQFTCGYGIVMASGYKNPITAAPYLSVTWDWVTVVHIPATVTSVKFRIFKF